MVYWLPHLVKLFGHRHAAFGKFNTDSAWYEIMARSMCSNPRHMQKMTRRVKDNAEKKNKTRVLSMHVFHACLELDTIQ